MNPHSASGHQRGGDKEVHTALHAAAGRAYPDVLYHPGCGLGLFRGLGIAGGYIHLLFLATTATVGDRRRQAAVPVLVALPCGALLCRHRGQPGGSLAMPGTPLIGCHAARRSSECRRGILCPLTGASRL